MPDGNPSDGQKEITALQGRILTLEETIAKLSSAGAGGSKKNEEEIAELKQKIEALNKEKADLQARIWDGQNRRKDERRHKLKETQNRSKEEDLEDIASGHF